MTDLQATEKIHNYSASPVIRFGHFSFIRQLFFFSFKTST